MVIEWCTFSVNNYNTINKEFTDDNETDGSVFGEKTLDSRRVVVEGDL